MMQGHSWNEDDNDIAPLVENNDTESTASALRKRRQRKQRLKSLEIAMLAQEESNGTTTCLGDSWRFIASIILASIIMGPLLLRHYQSDEWPSDSLQCARDLHMLYSKTWKEIEKANDYCRETHASCTCTSPLIPKAAVDDVQWPQWNKVHERNVALAMNASDVNVVLLGDSITEHWQGTSMGNPKYPEIHEVYKELFRNKQKTGIALGISGDRCPQLLYRLKNGEIPAALRPKVWWLLIGTNDLASGGCSRETVLVGIINLVKEIQTHDRDSTIVVNSILPRSEDESGILEGDLWNDICWINNRMSCYVEGVPGAEFINSTSVFLKNDDTQYINKTLMPDLLHPSAEGCRLWGAEIVKRVKELLL